MISVQDQYFNLNRILLIILGLWPYQTSKLSQLQLCCIYSILITSIIFQLTPFMTLKFSADLFLHSFSITSFFICGIIKYNAFYVNNKTIKYLMEQLQCICDSLKENEVVIMNKYGNIAKRLTFRFTILFGGGGFVVIISQLCSTFFSVNLSVNTSRQYRLQQIIITEYFINQEKYSNFIFVHMSTAMWIVIYVLLATGTILIAYLQHACGMFKIARFSTHLISAFETSFFFLILFGVLSLSLNLLRIFKTVSTTCIFDELLVSLAITVTLSYMFIANFIGQEITDHNNDVYVTTYKTQWYLLPVRIQRLILSILQRGNKAFGLKVGGVFIVSLQCFATLVNASISYCTVIYSAKK